MTDFEIKARGVYLVLALSAKPVSLSYKAAIAASLVVSYSGFDGRVRHKKRPSFFLFTAAFLESCSQGSIASEKQAQRALKELAEKGLIERAPAFRGAPVSYLKLTDKMLGYLNGDNDLQGEGTQSDRTRSDRTKKDRTQSDQGRGHNRSEGGSESVRGVVQKGPHTNNNLLITNTNNNLPITEKASGTPKKPTPVELKAPEGLTDENVAFIVRCRKKIKKGTSQAALNLTAKGIREAVQLYGHTVDECLELYEAYEWTGFKAHWDTVRDLKKSPSNTRKGSGPTTKAERLREAADQAMEMSKPQPMVNPSDVVATQGREPEYQHELDLPFAPAVYTPSPEDSILQKTPFSEMLKERERNKQRDPQS